MSSLFSLPFSYLLWHYTAAWGDLLRLYRNFSWFLWNFFSVRILAGTLLSPWHRLHETAQKDTGGLLGSLLINTILRGIGFCARVLTILSGLIALVLLSIFFVVFLVLWPLLPLLVVALISKGLMGLVTL